MLRWALILMLNGQYDLLDTYDSQAECEKAAELIVQTRHDQTERVLAGCYQHNSTTSWMGK